jgi:hypothetical protein
METRRYVADELLERLDGLLADVRALHAEVHQLSSSGDRDTDAPADSKHPDKKKQPKNKKKGKKKSTEHKKTAKARND